MYGTIHGRITKQPEYKEGTKDGNKWQRTTFSVACNNPYPSKESTFYECVIFGKRAETIDNYFTKGSEIVVYGDLIQEPYEGEDGKTKRPWKLKVINFDFCGSKGDGFKQSEPVPEGFIEMDESVPF